MSNSDDDISFSTAGRKAKSIATSDTDTGDGASSKSGALAVAKRETAAVNCSKLIVFTVLAVSAVIVGMQTYTFLHKEEENDFITQFNDYAAEISGLTHHRARNVYLGVASFSSGITSYALETDAVWPFLTVPHFEVRGSQSNELSESVITAFSPLVSEKTKDKWQAYSVENQNRVQSVESDVPLRQEFTEGEVVKPKPISEFIFRYEDGKRAIDSSGGPYLPVWQLSPPPRGDAIMNFNLLSHPIFSRVYDDVLVTGQPMLSEVFPLDFFYSASVTSDATHPHSFLLQPVYKEFDKESNETEITGVVISILPWDRYFRNLLPPNVNGITLILEDTCNQTFTYTINGRDVDYIGPGDFHDTNYDEFVIRTEFKLPDNLNRTITSSQCEFFIKMYPTSMLEDEFKSRRPVIFTVVVLLIFLTTSLFFVIYDYLIQRRQDKVMMTAQRSNAIVSSLFPSNVRDRIMEAAEGEAGMKNGKDKMAGFAVTKTKLKEFLTDEGTGKEDEANVFGSKPIADLFASATVMFADIVGFTAWSSVREPSQVFQLLETLYLAFDEIAKKRRVFKVETIGDCYVAVTGLPEPRVDHAIVMARFARDCLTTMNDLSKKLELSLGPDTGDLCMRVGLNSGPVTAGVLRGEKSRFQLFGDTVNTAARMESNGKRNRIHLSQETADLLTDGGKGQWITPRKEKVFAKGKGKLQTYWLDIVLPNPSAKQEEVVKVGYTEVKPTSEEVTQPSSSFVSSPDTPPVKPLLTDKVERLVSWNSDVLLRLLKQIVARRNAAGKKQEPVAIDSIIIETEEGKTVLDEVKDIIKMPRFNAKAAKRQEDPSKIVLGQQITEQLRDYVTVIATLYRENPFHNFEHASHVTMSVVKLLSRIVAPDGLQDDEAEDDNGSHFNKNLHDHTYGITSDPLTQFAVVLSALIHDVDHSGVPNAQLVKENVTIASIYKNKSVAEQNSVDISWDLLMDDSFKDLCSVIYTNQAELKRFRQLVVNAVMATDIVDKELKDLRNSRWDKAFAAKEDLDTDKKIIQENKNRKATIVIEHLIQASDVAHTMQHWHIYRKWNERFFQENLHAYKCGRAEKDPSEFWYKGEIGFFDFYIIPLAKKLKDCGVFGVSHDEYLNYALANRKEWELKGEQVVAEMIEKYKGMEFSYTEEQNKLGDEEKKDKV